MEKTLIELQGILLQGQKLSMQGSLDRRMPDKKAVPYLLEARKGLKEYIELLWTYTSSNDLDLWDKTLRELLPGDDTFKSYSRWKNINFKYII